jgi:hypothetical protein
MRITYPETNRGHRKTPPNRYTLSIVFALALACGTAFAEDGVTYSKQLSERQYEALRASVSQPEPEGFVGYRRQSANMTDDGVIVSTDTLKPGTVNISYVPGEKAAHESDVFNNQATQAAIANITQMNYDLATMKHDTVIINAAIAQGKKPDQEFRDAFEKAEQEAVVAAQQPTQARIVQPKESPVVYEAPKALMSLEKKDAK